MTMYKASNHFMLISF